MSDDSEGQDTRLFRGLADAVTAKKPAAPAVPARPSGESAADAKTITKKNAQPPSRSVEAVQQQEDVRLGDDTGGAAKEATAAQPLTASQQQDLLEQHNCHRRRYGIAPLAWNASLAQQASTYAAQLASTGGCQIKHSGVQGQGENLALSFGRPVSANGWIAEEPRFKCGGTIGNDFLQYGHWTQMMWPGTTSVGCGIGRCPNGTEILVCRYSPQGNVSGRAPFTQAQCDTAAASSLSCPYQVGRPAPSAKSGGGTGGLITARLPDKAPPPLPRAGTGDFVPTTRVPQEAAPQQVPPSVGPAKQTGIDTTTLLRRAGQGAGEGSAGAEDEAGQGAGQGAEEVPGEAQGQGVGRLFPTTRGTLPEQGAPSRAAPPDVKQPATPPSTAPPFARIPPPSDARPPSAAAPPPAPPSAPPTAQQGGKQPEKSVADSAGFSGDGLTQDERNTLLSIHNTARAEVGVPPLAWDTALARAASEYASYCDDPLIHWSQSNRPRPCFKYDPANPNAPLSAETRRITGRQEAQDGCMPMGENLYVGTGCPPAAAAAQFWYDEIACTVCGATIPHEPPIGGESDCVPMKSLVQQSCANKPCNMCGHYTQMVWATTRRVGCAKKQCPRGDYIVCEYFPGGNVEGLLPFDCTVCDSLKSRFNSVVPCRKGLPVGDESNPRRSGSGPVAPTTPAPSQPSVPTPPPPPAPFAAPSSTARGGVGDLFPPTRGPKKEAADDAKEQAAQQKAATERAVAEKQVEVDNSKKKQQETADALKQVVEKKKDVEQKKAAGETALSNAKQAETDAKTAYKAALAQEQALTDRPGDNPQLLLQAQQARAVAEQEQYRTARERANAEAALAELMAQMQNIAAEELNARRAADDARSQLDARTNELTSLRGGQTTTIADDKSANNTWIYVVSSIGALLLIGLIVFLVVFFVRKRGKGATSGTNLTAEGSSTIQQNRDEMAR